MVIVTACAPTIDVRGNMPDPEMLKILETGVHNKDHVAELLGPPSIVSPFTPNLWVYMGRKTETTSFFTPVVLEEKITVLKFNQNDMLIDLYDIDPKSGLPITPSNQVTPTSGHDISFLTELFGSFGQFHRPGVSAN